jgi:hypothetical protein
MAEYRSRNPAYQEAKRLREELGWCTRCQRQEAPIGQAVCFDCIDEMAEGKRRAISQGLCIDCWKAPVVPNRRQCLACLERRREKDRQRYATRKRQGLCTLCGRRAAWQSQPDVRQTTGHLCFICWEKSHAR